MKQSLRKSLERLHDSKRGSVYSLMVYIFEHAFFRLLFLIIVILTSLFILHSILLADFDSKIVEKDALLYSMLYNPDGFSYNDPNTGRSYPGLIDMTKFNSQQLDDAASLKESDNIGMKFTLIDIGSGQQLKDATATLNSEYFDKKYPFAKQRVKGQGSAKLYTDYIVVTYLPDPNKPTQKGLMQLKVETVIAN